jgi:hypothetical protein
VRAVELPRLVLVDALAARLVTRLVGRAAAARGAPRPRVTRRRGAARIDDAWRGPRIGDRGSGADRGGLGSADERGARVAYIGGGGGVRGACIGGGGALAGRRLFVARGVREQREREQRRPSEALIHGCSLSDGAAAHNRISHRLSGGSPSPEGCGCLRRAPCPHVGARSKGRPNRSATRFEASRAGVDTGPRAVCRLCRPRVPLGPCVTGCAKRDGPPRRLKNPGKIVC